MSESVRAESVIGAPSVVAPLRRAAHARIQGSESFNRGTSHRSSTGSTGTAGSHRWRSRPDDDGVAEGFKRLEGIRDLRRIPAGEVVDGEPHRLAFSDERGGPKGVQGPVPCPIDGRVSRADPSDRRRWGRSLATRRSRRRLERPARSRSSGSPRASDPWQKLEREYRPLCQFRIGQRGEDGLARRRADATEGSSSSFAHTVVAVSQGWDEERDGSHRIRGADGPGRGAPDDRARICEAAGAQVERLLRTGSRKGLQRQPSGSGDPRSPAWSSPPRAHPRATVSAGLRRRRRTEPPHLRLRAARGSPRPKRRTHRRGHQLPERQPGGLRLRIGHGFSNARQGRTIPSSRQRSEGRRPDGGIDVEKRA